MKIEYVVVQENCSDKIVIGLCQIRVKVYHFNHIRTCQILSGSLYEVLCSSNKNIQFIYYLNKQFIKFNIIMLESFHKFQESF